MSTKTPLPTVNEKVTESVSIAGCLLLYFAAVPWFVVTHLLVGEGECFTVSVAIISGIKLNDS